MVGDVEAQSLLLEREVGLLGELRDRNGGVHNERRPVPVGRSEQGVLSCVLLLSRGDGLCEDLLEALKQSLACVRALVAVKRLEGPRLDQRLDRFLVEAGVVDLAAEIVERGEVTLGAPGFDYLGDHALADPSHRGEPEANRVLYRSEVQLGRVDVGDQHRDPTLARHVQVLGLVVLAVLDRGQQRGHVLDRVVGLKPGGLIRDVGVAGGVGPVEGIVGERLNQGPQALGLGLRQPGANAALDEHGLLSGHHLAVLLADGLPHHIRSARCVPGEPLQHQHDLLLVDQDPVGLLGDVLERFVQVGDLAGVVLAFDVSGDLFHRARAVERDQSHDLLEAIGSQLHQQPAHAVRLELKDSVTVAFAQHVVDLGIGEVERVHVDLLTRVRLDRLLSELNDREVSQTEEVHLEEPELLDEAHVVLGNDLAMVAALERDVLDQGVGPDNDAGRMDARRPLEVLDLQGGVDDLLGRSPLGVEVPELRRALERVGEPRVPSHDQLRVHLAELVALGIGMPEHARRVPDRLLSLDRAVGDDLCDVVAAVAVLDVTHDIAAPAVVEVDVYVRHRLALGVEEALEHEVVAQRVELGDADRVADDRAGRAAASGSDSDASSLGPIDEVLHHEEIAGEAHLLDHFELVFGALARLGRDLAVALGDALKHELVKIGLERVTRRNVVYGEQQVSEGDVDVASVGDLERGLARPWPPRKTRGHLFWSLDVELVGVELEAVRVAQH